MQNFKAIRELPSPLTRQLRQERESLERRFDTIRHEMLTNRNMLTLINAKLPPEILSNVFRHVKQEYKSSRGTTTSSRWIQCISHVCHRWRSIALSEPSLWADGFPMNSVAIQTFLDRSRSLPIVVDKNIVYRILSHYRSRSLILSHMERTGALYMDVPSTQINGPIIINALATDMPHLKVLDLSFSSPWPNPIPNPENLQHLRTLKLSRCWFNYDRVEVSNLTTLCLSGDFPSNLKPSMKQISAILRLSPGLQFLELTKIPFSEVQSLNSAVPPLDFSLFQLKHLKLAETGLLVVKALVNPAVLRDLESIILEISTNDERVMTDIFFSVSSVLKQKSASVIQTRSYDIDISEKRFFSYSHDLYGECGLLSSLSFSNSWERNNDSEMNLPQTLLSYLELFNLDGLLKFNCSLDRTMPEPWWRDVLSRTPALETLRVEDWSLRGLIYALRPKEASRRKNGSAPSRDQHILLSPSLSKLTLLHVRNPLHKRSSSGQLLRQLADCIELRNRRRAGLLTLGISHRSSLHESSNADLGKYVLKLICLGDKGFKEEVDSDGFPKIVNYLHQQLDDSDLDDSSYNDD
jgi:hypothetical protein